ncbi:hypothetical protein OS493_018885 [Desmophyllum pertusum]|uniref:G-protein coupled receptors family 1 profile domain-containing protein n=1 Tax=Desmophyllum pertusum TaxID=174260 RepID=A0A9W9ZCJ9_9CNID|nr:hypothetical protein OS493_018885 [Desmophyllum pertusum]
MNESHNFTASFDSSGDDDGSGSGSGEYDIEEEISDVTQIIVISAYAIIFLFSFVGNSLIIHIVRTRTSIRQNSFNWLLVNTAVADLLDVITASAFSVPFFLCENCWISGVIGTILCKLIPFLLDVSICVSIWTLTIIAADRYLAIVCTGCQTQKKPLSSRAVVRSIIAVWLLAGLIFSGDLYKYKVEEAEEEEEEFAVCSHQWHVDSELSDILYQAEMIVKVVIAYAVPLVIMVVLYSLIVNFLWKHKPPGNTDQNQQAHAKRTRNFRAVIKMLMTAVAVFALCWLPVHVCHIMSEFYKDSYNDIPLIAKGLLYWLAHANAAIHPWLFITFSENLRREAKGISQSIYKETSMFLTNYVPSPCQLRSQPLNLLLAEQTQ